MLWSFWVLIQLNVYNILNLRMDCYSERNSSFAETVSIYFAPASTIVTVMVPSFGFPIASYRITSPR